METDNIIPNDNINNKSPPVKASHPEPTTTQPLRSSTDSTSRAPPPPPPPPPTPDAVDVISIPSYSRWFSWDNIHQCELRFLPEFFDGRSPSKNPKVYKYYRNAIIHRFRDHPTKKISFTEVRKTIIGDVGSIRRVFDFLEAWGLINYSASSKAPQPQLQLKWEDKDKDKDPTKSNPPPPRAADAPPTATAAASADNTTAPPKKRLCSACKCVCTIACFASDKHDLTLCARCYVRQNYRVGISTSDFRRVEISEVVKTDWTDKETVHLLEAIMHYGDDWKKVADHVSGRTEKECVARFVKLPFGDQFVGSPESSEMEHGLGSKYSSFPNKRMRFTPLADASNPIMAQAAFLSALVGVEVAEVAAHAAVTALSDLSGGIIKENLKSASGGVKKQDSGVAPNGDTGTTMDGALAEAQSKLQKEEEELQRALSGIAVETKEIQEKIVQFEELDLQLEKEWQQLRQLKDLLFVDQLTVLFHKADVQRTGGSLVENVNARED